MESNYQGHDLALGDFGGCLSVTTYTIGNCERTWPFGWLTQSIKAKFETWVKSRALAEIAKMREMPDLDALTYQEHLSAYQHDVLAGKYAWASPRPKKMAEVGMHIWAAAQTEEGMRQLVYYHLAAVNREMTIPLANAICDEQWELVQLLREQVASHPLSDTPAGREARAAETADPTLTAKREAAQAEARQALKNSEKNRSTSMKSAPTSSARPDSPDLVPTSKLPN